MMQKRIPLLALFSAALLLLAVPIQASAQCCVPCNTCDPCYDPCCSPCCDPCCKPCCGNFEVGVHALLFKPLICRWDYAHRIDSDQVHGRVATLDPNLDWGVRVFGRYKCNCTYVYLGYQWFEAKDSDHISGDNDVQIRDNFSIGDHAHTRLHWRYQNVDLRLGSEKEMCCALVRRYVNLRWVDLCYRRRIDLEHISVNDDHIHGHEKAHLQGVALGLGAGGNRDLWCGLGLFVDLNFLGLIADSKTHADFEQYGTLEVHAHADYRSITTITPELNFKLGFDYHWCCGCWNIVGEIGYELDYFWNAFNFPQELNLGLVQESSSEWVTVCEDVGFSGLFFGVRVLF